MKQLKKEFSEIPERYFVIDFENTGGSLWKGHKITAYGICIVEKIYGVYKITNSYTNFINPDRKIPKYIEDLIGIKTDFVINGNFPYIENEFEIINNLFEDDMIFTAHCVGVDFGMFDYLYYQKFQTHRAAFTIDTCYLSKNILDLEFGSIGKIAEYYQFSCGKHHQPDFDAYVAAQILIKSIEICANDIEKKKKFLNAIKILPKPQSKKKNLNKLKYGIVCK